MKAAAALLVALTLGSSAAAPPDDRSGGRLSVDVVVTDGRGRRVEQLSAGDFAVAEAGRPLTIEAVRFAGPAPQRLAVFLDEYHLTPGPAADRVREALMRFVGDALAPDDRVVVLRPLDSLLTIRLAAGRQDAQAALTAFDPRRGDYQPRSDLERQLIAGAPARVEAARARIATSAVGALVARLAAVEAPATGGAAGGLRKTLIVVSEGFAVDAVRRGEEVAPGIDAVIDAANRANVAIYAINPVVPDASTDGVTADRRPGDTLRRLATATGGAYVEAPPDVTASLQAAQADASGYYALTVAAPADAGSAMRVIEVTTPRRGLTLRVRRSVGLPMPVTPAVPTTPSFLSQYAAQFPRRTSPLIRPWFGMDRGDAGKTRVSFVWEPAPRVPGERRPPAVPSRVALSITTLDGEPVFSGEVPAVGVGTAGADSGSRASFDVTPGRFLVRITIEDLAARVLDHDVRDLVVGGFSGAVALGTPEVLRARTVREQQQLTADPHAAPVATRQFSRSERLLVRVPVVTTGDEPIVSARLMSSFGSLMQERSGAPVPGRPDLYQFDLPLASLAAGAYTLEIAARSGTGSAADRLVIRVTP